MNARFGGDSIHDCAADRGSTSRGYIPVGESEASAVQAL
ncbi:hypothetical protein BO443_20042 [Burkholderia orbicola]